MQSRLSTLWIFAVLNYLYCDVLTLMDPVLLKQFVAGYAGGFAITPGFLVGAAVLMEIPIGMILLSRVLRSHRANRWANIGAGAVMTVVQVASLFAGTGPAPYYVFFSIIEILCTALIVWYAWRWVSPERQTAIEPGPMAIQPSTR
jgi:hypothetical protein